MLHGENPGSVEFLDRVRSSWSPTSFSGQKTGAFLDQAENRNRGWPLRKGRALDCFTYGGAFALQLARKADARDSRWNISEQAAAQGARGGCGATASRTSSSRSPTLFDLLPGGEARPARATNTIVLDPPAFAKSKDNHPRRRCAGTRRSICARSI